MIRAMIFDLDGTLVQTEKLKALSYARAAVKLSPYSITEKEVIDVFKDYVGRARREVAVGVLERFKLTEAARAKQAEFGVDEPWQAFARIRLKYYEEMLADDETIRAHQWPHNMALLKHAREAGYKLGLATMSHCGQVNRILSILEIQDTFDFVASHEDVEHGKPDPEIYFIAASQLGVAPDECLVIEDSPNGVEAALRAGMQVVAVGTPFTRELLCDSGLLPENLIVDDPKDVLTVTNNIIKSYENV